MKKNKILQISFLLLLAVLSGNMHAQQGYAWKSIGTAADNIYYDFKAQATTLFIQKRINGDLYVVRGLVNGGKVKVSKWNGTNWSLYPEVTLPYANIRDIGVLNGQVYLSGSKYDSVTISHRLNDLPFPMIRFNGTSWEGLPNTPSKDSTGWNQWVEGFIDNLTAWNGRLYYVSHSFVFSRGAKHRLYEIDESGVHKLVKTYDDPKAEGSVMLCVHNNKLVIGGAVFNRKDLGTPVSGLETYNGSNFTLYEHSMLAGGVAPFRGYNNPLPTGLLSMNDSVLALITNGIYISGIESRIILLKHGVFYKNLPNPHPVWRAYIINAMASVGNSLHVEYDWWNQSSFQYHLDSNKWVPWRKDTILICAQSDKSIYGFRLDGDYLNGQSKIIDFVEMIKGSTISGRAFADVNSNCKIDIGDKNVKNSLIEFDNGINRFYVCSDDNGKYEASVLPGNYNITCYADGMISSVAVCPKASITTKETDSVFKNVNVPVHFSNSKNLGVSIDAFMGFRVRHGFAEYYVLTGTNYSLKNDSLVIKLKYPSKSTLIKSDIQPFSHFGNELVYKFGNLEWNDSRRILLQFGTSTQTSDVNDKLQFHASVINSEGDTLMENNDDILDQRIFAAYDPNIKQSSPEGRVQPGLKKIKYVIHFQNTGNDTAYKVTVVDTITQKLGLRYLKVTSTSHPASYSLKVVDNQTLVWEFNNILLPDSHRNEKASHGYVAFEAAINGKVAEGDSINNKAYIYFDYQKPVITNTASVVLDSEVDIKTVTLLDAKGLMLYPNPANTFVNVVADKKYDDGYICLFNSLGQEVGRQKLDDGNTTFNIEKLPKGIYFVKIEGTLIGKKLLVE